MSPAIPPLTNEPPAEHVVVQRVLGSDFIDGVDALAEEEPLEIRLIYSRNGRRRQRILSVTMRTPGADRELAAGFLLTEGIVQTSRDILVAHPCRNGNRIRVHLRNDVIVNLKQLKRNFYMSSSCGVCGKSSIEAVRVCATPIRRVDSPQVSIETIHALPDRLRMAQAIFARTGGLHASALFSSTGELLCVREDVGRHNALDKVIGHELLAARLPLSETILLVSGRASFELVQKAAVAGIPILAAVGAPSSLAVRLAEEQGMTLLGFVRQSRFNIYCGSQRILGRSPEPHSKTRS